VNDLPLLFDELGGRNRRSDRELDVAFEGCGDARAGATGRIRIDFKVCFTLATTGFGSSFSKNERPK
jgi:hypothetical protein